MTPRPDARSSRRSRPRQGTVQRAMAAIRPSRPQQGTVQPAGKRAMAAADWMRGAASHEGPVLS